MNLRPPVKLNPYRGKTFYRFSVRVTQSGLDQDLWKKQLVVPVIAPNATAAVNLLQDEVAPALDYPAEFDCAGPKGGVVHRFTGYESLIWAKMCRVNSNETQLSLL